jgi:hypothetical protein
VGEGTPGSSLADFEVEGPVVVAKMVDWSGTISRPFDTFQRLPELVREALVYEAGRNEIVYDWCERDIYSYIKCRRDMNTTLSTWELIDISESFIEFYTNRRMVICYMENHYDMVLAKLAWREDY